MGLNVSVKINILTFELTNKRKPFLKITANTGY